MTPQEQLTGEILASRSISQALCYLLVQGKVIPREQLENQLGAIEQYWAKRAAETGDLAAGVASLRTIDFLAEFRKNTGGSVQ